MTVKSYQRGPRTTEGCREAVLLVSDTAKVAAFIATF
jgi:hypothetical protein